MDFAWTREQLEFRASVVEFARKLNGNIQERDAEGIFPREEWNPCARFGIQGLAVPEEYGGMGCDVMTTVLALEGLGYGCEDNGLIFALNAHMWSAAAPLVRFGTEEQRRRYLPGLCNGELIGVQGMTEPESGSDAFSARTRAVREGDVYVLNGTKTFISNAPVADVFVVFASTRPSLRAMGLSAFLVERDAPGIKVGRPF